jgi:uncharacterized membrane protein
MKTQLDVLHSDDFVKHVNCNTYLSPIPPELSFLLLREAEETSSSS